MGSKNFSDKYFWNKHREEARGVGGIFFDYLNDRNPDEIFKFIELGLTAFIDAYFPIFEKQYKNPFLENHVKSQRQRRGRYVEFNVLCDRCALFCARCSRARSVPRAGWRGRESVPP